MCCSPLPSFSVRCPFCKSATLEVAYTGPLPLEAARAQRREDERVEAQRLHAAHEQQQVHQQVPHQQHPHGTPDTARACEEEAEDAHEEEEEEDTAALLGDGYGTGSDEALLVAWLRRLGLGAADAGAGAVLAAGAALAQRLEALCALHDLARAADVRDACACCADPAAAATLDPAARVCAQLIDALV